MMCLILSLLSIALWLAAGAGFSHLLKTAYLRITAYFRLAEQSRRTQIYIVAPPQNETWLTAGEEGRRLDWPQPSPADMWRPTPVQYGPRQLPAEPSLPADLDLTVPRQLAPYQASAYLDEVLRSVGDDFGSIRLRRGQSIAMDALARAAQSRGLVVRWVNGSQFTDSGWVIGRV